MSVDESPEGDRPAPPSPFATDPAAIPVDDLRRSYRRLTKLYELAQQLFSQEALPTLFARIVATAVELLDVERALLATVEGGKEIAQATHAMTVCPGEPLPISSTMVRKVIDSGESILTFDAVEERDYRVAQSVVAHGIRSVMCCPLGPPKEPLGLLYVDNTVRRRAFDASDLQFLQALSHYACIAIQNLTRVQSERAVAKARVETLQRAYGPGHDLVYRSAAMHSVWEMVKKVAPTQVSVLLLGETGTGKEVVARAVHHESDRKDGPWVPVNMGALSSELAESQLFGHVKGAFTGATSDHPGFFVQAHGGVIFLDEITAASHDIQVKLLRVLAEKEVWPIGAKSRVPVDVRVIAAANVDIDREVREHRFREDLFFRLNVARIDVPPLRGRPDDIEPLISHFLALLAPGKSIDPVVLRALCAHDWRGNVRELRNIIEILGILAQGDTIRMSDLPDRVAKTGGSAPPPTPSEAPEPLAMLLERVEKEHIKRALDFTHGHKDRALKLLEMSRATFFDRLRRFGLGDYSNSGSGGGS